jgi:pimeloyl-ACP methyl ester carboxylesterase
MIVQETRVIPAAIAGFRSETAVIGGLRVHYWIGGDPGGQPILLWHGFLGTSYSWAAVAPKLAEAGLAVIVPDMPGFGDSAKPAEVAGYDGRALAECFRALIQTVGMAERPLLIAAHDMGAPPALLWASDHPDEIAGLLYIEAPVMLSGVLQKIISYTADAMKSGSMWWWVIPLAPGVPELLVVGHEREFLTWFYRGATAKPEAFTTRIVDEYLRTFSGNEGVLGSMGVYRAAFTTIDQTEPLTKNKVQCPVVAIGGVKGLGVKVGQGVALVAAHVDAHVIDGCGHFVPEECPSELVQHIVALASAIALHNT